MTKMSRSRVARRRTVTVFADNMENYRVVCRRYDLRPDDTTLVFNACLAVVAAAIRAENNKKTETPSGPTTEQPTN